MFACSLQLSTAKLQCPNNPRRQDNIILIRFTDFNTTYSDLFRNFAALAAEAGTFVTRSKIPFGENANGYSLKVRYGHYY